jgi:hypothetical protein
MVGRGGALGGGARCPIFLSPESKYAKTPYFLAILTHLVQNLHLLSGCPGPFFLTV